MRLHPVAFRLLREFKPYKGAAAIVLALGLVISLIQPAAVKLSQTLIDEIRVGMRPEALRWLPLGLVGIFAVSGLAKFFHNVLRRSTCERVLLKFRESLFRKFLALPLSTLDRSRSGEMLSSLQNDLALIGTGIDTVCDLAREPFTFLGLIGVAFYCDWQLTALTLLVAPLVAWCFSASGSAVKRYSRRNLGQFSDLLSLTHEALAGNRVIKVFNLDKALTEKFNRIQTSYYSTVVKSIKVQELATPLVEFIGAVVMAGVLAYGGYRSSQGSLTTGELIGFVVALGLAQMPIKTLNNAFMKLRQAEAAAERVYGLLDLPEAPAARVPGTRLPRFGGRIEYDRVGLSYGDKSALKEVSFQIGNGECVAFVGHSGSGKTSAVNLLPRLYEVTSGAIRIDGVDIRDLEVDELRSLISYVSQDTFLFNDTVFENIRFGRLDATREEVERAAEMAYCTEFITKTPGGFEAQLGDRGVCLSGGERQRIAIARAFLKGAPILILDEATSSLDTRSERIVQRALDVLKEGKTTLLVAHRLSTVRDADRILVFEAGDVRESGTHEELLDRREGVYRDLYLHQAPITAPGPTVPG